MSEKKVDLRDLLKDLTQLELFDLRKKVEDELTDYSKREKRKAFYIKQAAVINYVMENHMKKGEEPEYVGRETGFNTNHEFPVDIKKTLEAIGFEKKEHRYYGTATNSVPQKLQIEFGVDGNMLSCRNLTNLKYIFMVDTSIEVGYFIVLLQAYGIIHHRYIYERIRGIRDQFDENHSDNF